MSVYYEAKMLATKGILTNANLDFTIKQRVHVKDINANSVK